MDYSLESDNAYTVDKWYKLVSKWIAFDIDGHEYYPATQYKLIVFDISDAIHILTTKTFPVNIETQINKILQIQSYFFRISQRSPKDAYANEFIASETDSYKHKLFLEIKRKQMLLVSSISNILDLIFRSKRVMEDLEQFVNQNIIKELHLVFQPWRASTGIEYRLFVYRTKLVGICIYKPEFYTSKLTIPVGLITHWFGQFEKIYQQTSTYTVDIFVDNLTSRVHFIEINPFNNQVDTFAFTYKQLIRTKFLLVKIR